MKDLSCGKLKIFVLVMLFVMIGYANTTASEQGLQEIIAKQEILEIISLYSHSWDSKNPEKLSEIFAENAVWEWYPPGGDKPLASFPNRNKLIEWASERFKTKLADRQTRHFQTNTVFIELTDNTARTETMLLLFYKVKGEKQPTAMGTAIYKDEFIKTQDGWKIKRRAVFGD